jgi:hypothetical protein
MTLLLLQTAAQHPLNASNKGVAIFGSDGADNQFSQDAVRSDSSRYVTEIFHYIFNPDKMAALALQYPEFGSRLFFAGFGLEAIGNDSDDYYSLAQLLQNIEAWFSGPLSVNLPTTTVKDFALNQNYPNPFNPSTRISYRLSRSSTVKLVVYDISGRLIMTLVNEPQNSGSYSIEFNSSQLASGIYFYRLETEHFTRTRSMVLIK